MPETGGAPDRPEDKRLERRDRVIKNAKIVFADSVIDCIVLDISLQGARLRTRAVVVVPEQVILQFSGGSAFAATRQWARGLEMGFMFAGRAPLAGQAALDARSAIVALSASGMAEAMRILRTARFFDDPELAEIAAAAEAAHARIKTALEQRTTLKS